MSSGVRFAKTLRRLLRLACAVATLLVVVAPAAFGPAMGPVLEQLGVAGDHACKCGMAKGKCGCPMCEQLAHERQREQVPESIPVLKRQCEKDAPGLTFTGVPMSPVVPVLATLPAVPRGARLVSDEGVLAPPQREAEPPTPPPRLAAV